MSSAGSGRSPLAALVGWLGSEFSSNHAGRGGVPSDQCSQSMTPSRTPPLHCMLPSRKSPFNPDGGIDVGNRRHNRSAPVSDPLQIVLRTEPNALAPRSTSAQRSVSPLAGEARSSCRRSARRRHPPRGEGTDLRSATLTAGSSNVTAGLERLTRNELHHEQAAALRSDRRGSAVHRRTFILGVVDEDGPNNRACPQELAGAHRLETRWRGLDHDSALCRRRTSCRR